MKSRNTFFCWISVAIGVGSVDCCTACSGDSAAVLTMGESGGSSPCSATSCAVDSAVGGKSGSPSTGGASAASGGKQESDAGGDGAPSGSTGGRAPLDAGAARDSAFADASSRETPCQSNLDCAMAADGKFVCDPATQRCVACLENADCTAKPADQRVCDNGTKTCVGCVQNSDCSTTPSTHVCYHNSCACADLDSDPANCGTCGHACRPGVHCVRGVCPDWSACSKVTTCDDYCAAKGEVCSPTACGSDPGPANGTSTGAYICEVFTPTTCSTPFDSGFTGQCCCALAPY